MDEPIENLFAYSLEKSAEFRGTIEPSEEFYLYMLKNQGN
jgi:hypothetical protein